MGVEPVIMYLWLVQLAAAVSIAVRRMMTGRWFAAIGVVVGTGLVFLPVLSGSRFLSSAEIGALLLSLAVLLVAYAVTRRWKSFAALFILVAAPVACALFGMRAFAPALMRSLLSYMELMGEFDLFLGPIMGGLAGGEVLGLFDRFLTRQRMLA